MTTQILAQPTPRPQPLAQTPEEKARNLYNLGYRAELCGNVLIVRNPAGRQYRVDPAAGCCSCPATRRCCHLYGYFELAIAQADALCWEGCSLDIAATANMVGCAYTAAGMGLRATAVECYDAANEMRCWAWAVAGVRQ